MRIGFIFSLLFGILVTIFALQNADTVSIKFFSGNIQISQALIIFISAISGALIVTLLGLYRELRLKLKLRQQNKTISQLQKEISEHKLELENLNTKLATSSLQNMLNKPLEEDLNDENSTE
ncbi:LapA family protein [Clostridium aestuarii]|uniref:LapA family protein n=1 Tax=Clostridium aestuarii TaxID=338193 RepID=A0ABT4CV54_9CLOT|nr:LapA family protein [Clostridium aestuarii]MCY6482867.1 LapA family protein [Clostridium aestuarii]